MGNEYANDEYLKELEEAGCDVSGAMNRFMGRADLYKKFLGKFLDDRSYTELLKCIEDHKIEDAFMHAHTLKGVAGNLGIDNLLKELIPVVEALRAGKEPEPEQVLACVREYELVAGVIGRH